MKRWFRSFSARLVLALTVLLGVLGAFFIALVLMATRVHLQTIDQSLNLNLAQTIVADRWLPLQAGLASGDYSPVFDRLMAINPSAEIYLLDPGGKILAFSAPPDRVRLDFVAMAPIQEILGFEPELPIYGDDPRDPATQRVFSATPIRIDDRLLGYVYVVLGGEAYRSVVDMFEDSYALRLSVWLSLGALVFAVVIGAFMFRVLCRRISALSQQMARFEASDFRVAQTQKLPEPPTDGDEIDQLARTFKRMSTRIADQFAALEHLDVSRRELVMHISHDLRTPLASLQGYLDTLEMKWNELSGDARRDYLNAALGFSRRLRGMIGDLFDLAILEVYTSPLRPETLDIDELVQDICQKYSPMAQQKMIDLRREFSQSRTLLFADIGLIERAVSNLLDNALRYTPDGGTVRVVVEKVGASVEITISDSGIGISSENLERVFERFYRVQTTPADGSGLGLAIVKRIVELHGGSISVSSVEGKGSSFTVRLPTPDQSNSTRHTA